MPTYLNLLPYYGHTYDTHELINSSDADTARDVSRNRNPDKIVYYSANL